jgi:GNAT superfamily N-acetyltransferase
MIKEIKEAELKSTICEDVLRDLPEWFGIEDALKEYIESVKKYVFFAVYEKNEVVGFYSLREENPQTLDMYVLGVKKKFHGLGFGTRLQEYVNEYAKKKGYIYLIVLTLSKRHPDVGYSKTRDFYHKMGFIDVYESDKIWDKHNPTQIMIKKL